jgi:tetratricopeptide (TPR) repeat protein
MVIRTNVIGYVFDSGKKITDIMNDPFIGMNMSERLATILYTLGQYVRLLVFPHPLTHDYYPYHIPIMEFSKPGTLISLAIYLVLAYIFFKLWKKKSIYAWAIGFYIATISIVSNLFFPVGTFMNERFIFLPSIAFSVVCAWMYVRYGVESENKVWKWGLTGLLLIVIGGYIFKTYVRVPAWKDSLSLNGQAAMVSVNSARNNCFMATALYEEAHKTVDPAAKKELFDEAEYYTEKSLAIYPTYLNANQIKSGLVAERYLRDKDLNKLLEGFMKIMQVRPQVEYIPQFLDYLNDRADKETLIDFYYKAGYELVSKTQRDYRTAMVILKVGEKLAPNDPRILYAIGKTLTAGGDRVQGDQYLAKAYQLNPSLRDSE